MKRLSVSSPDISDVDGRNFWEPKGYSTIAQRTADGFALCHQFRCMIEGLETAVSAFTKSLGVWSETWKAKIGRLQLQCSLLLQCRMGIRHKRTTLLITNKKKEIDVEDCPKSMIASSKLALLFKHERFS